ncbi:uncharacterized protein LOC135168505 [Diachasmimorpha longicaudata]|uniref:uncharacterized protein LOC135168505 n=1 Tax=Diachasmimorpha longicaudata TaxID=58733 RepID=UPI0030B8772B
MANKVTRIPGQRPEIWNYIYRQFKHYIDKTVTFAGRTCFRCAYRRNEVAIWELPDGTVIENGKTHRHAADVEAMQRNEFLIEMNEAIRAGGTLQSVTHHLAERFHHFQTYNAIRMKVRRAMPPTSIPIELDHFANCIKNCGSEDNCDLYNKSRIRRHHQSSRDGTSGSMEC